MRWSSDLRQPSASTSRKSASPPSREIRVIYGIGADLIDVERIRAAHLRFGERFVERVLGPREVERYRQRRARSQRRGALFFSTRFAPKEGRFKGLRLRMRAR